MMNRSLPYPPPWQDAPTLCAHLCISETTLDVWIKQKILPAPRPRGGKRMWKWSEVETYMEGNPAIVPEQDDKVRVFNATKQAARG